MHYLTLSEWMNDPSDEPFSFRCVYVCMAWTRTTQAFLLFISSHLSSHSAACHLLPSALIFSVLLYVVNARVWYIAQTHRHSCLHEWKWIKNPVFHVEWVNAIVIYHYECGSGGGGVGKLQETRGMKRLSSIIISNNNSSNNSITFQQYLAPSFPFVSREPPLSLLSSRWLGR